MEKKQKWIKTITQVSLEKSETLRSMRIKFPSACCLIVICHGNLTPIPLSTSMVIVLCPPA